MIAGWYIHVSTLFYDVSNYCIKKCNMTCMKWKTASCYFIASCYFTAPRLALPLLQSINGDLNRIQLRNVNEVEEKVSAATSGYHMYKRKLHI